MDAEIEAGVRTAVAKAAQESTTFGAERLTDLGWQSLLAEDSEAAIRAFFEEQGRLQLVSSALDSVVLDSVGGPWTWPENRVVLPRPGRSDCLDLTAGAGTGIEGVVYVDAASFESALVPVRAGSGVELVEVRAADATLVPLAGMDETMGLARFEADAGAATPVSEEPAGRWRDGLLAARRALAHELIGLSERMQQVAVEHVSVRHQFGRPLGMNQAVQHKLADARVDVAAAQTIVDESWRSPTPLMAVGAKAAADRAFGTIAAHGQQVLGAIGYTWEHPWRHLVRRGMVLSALLGGLDECEHEVAGHLLAQGVPRVGGLY